MRLQEQSAETTLEYGSRDGYHRGAVVRVRSGDRVVEMARPLSRLYHVEVESQVPEERQNRNTDFPITFRGKC